MAVLVVSKQELISADLTNLVIKKTGDINDFYYWSTDQSQAMICMLAGIGRILGKDHIDNH